MRSWLLVPGHRPERFGKAVASGTDEVILDLDHRVSPERKLSARRHVVRWLAEGGEAWVRVNAGASPWQHDDLEALRGSPGFAVDIGADGSGESLAFARGALVVASRAAGLPAPLDSAGTEVRRTPSVRAAALDVRRLGFGGMLCSDPAHVAAINHAFRSDPSGGTLTTVRCLPAARR